MSEKIEPALSPEDWAAAAKYEADYFRAEAGPVTWWEPVQVLALANAALPDGDRRKITREWVNLLRRNAYNVPDGWSGNPWMEDIADALESYLPPEPDAEAAEHQA